jgi:hypothetical protein
VKKAITTNEVIARKAIKDAIFTRFDINSAINSKRRSRLHSMT